jgi:predicted lipoprotein with Yx(FWY)xxD motif
MPWNGPYPARRGRLSGMLTRVFCATALGLGLLTACGENPDSESGGPISSARATDPSTDEPTAKITDELSTSSPPQPIDHGTRIVGANSDFGTMLFDGTGQAIYLFDVETTSKPGCYDACAEAWPPVLTEGQPVAADGVDDSLLGTTKRTDGAIQVTYNEHPLYFYAHEGKHEAKCHDVFMNGGNWYVVKLDGNPAPPA